MQKMNEKSGKTSIFMNFDAISQYVCEQKSNYLDILHAKTEKNHVKKHVKNGKSRNFQKALKP